MPDFRGKSPFLLRGRFSDFLGLGSSVVFLLIVIVHNDVLCLADLQFTVELLQPCGLFSKLGSVLQRLAFSSYGFGKVSLHTGELIRHTV